MILDRAGAAARYSSHHHDPQIRPVALHAVPFSPKPGLDDPGLPARDLYGTRHGKSGAGRTGRFGPLWRDGGRA